MRKVVVLAVFAIYTLGGIACVAIPVQFKITDCGTRHQIPSDSTAEEACDYLDYWSKKDC